MKRSFNFFISSFISFLPLVRDLNVLNIRVSEAVEVDKEGEKLYRQIEEVEEEGEDISSPYCTQDNASCS